MQLIEKLQKIGLVPVVRIDRVEDALPLAKALIDGGLPVAEVTFRTECAQEAMALISKEYPEMILGAGTVITKEQVHQAIEAGAHFIVSPGLNPEIVKECQANDILIIPGVANASDIECALSLGLKNLKFFPAESLGGVKMLKALCAPYGQVNFMPTGGVNAKNLREYLDFGKILCCGGSWMVDPKLVAAKDFDAITALTKEAVNNLLQLELLHVGINEPSALAEFTKVFDFTVKETSKSHFIGTGLEVMKVPYLGANGHIAYSTADLKRALAHFEAKGYSFNLDSASYNAQGELKSIYFNEEFGGFALHLVQK